MGSKIESKKIAKKSGVPILESIIIDGEFKEDEVIASVEQQGFPVIIKASAGGGGRGMQIVTEAKQLFPAIKKLTLEAQKAFGDGTLFIEKYIENPRHIEIQIIADQYGTILHLGERDCTIQRRFQKLIEESPSPVLTENGRKEMCQAAIKLARAVKYDSVGTVEFLYDLNTQQFYFMEMNTRVQVEHPVTEQRTYIDIIEEQIKAAMGERITYKQKDIVFNHHVMECRINAENAAGVPSPGHISHYHRPGGLGVRMDDYIYTGYDVPPFYDSMISKIIVTANNRDQCIRRMKRALKDTIIGGIETNISLHQKVLSSEKFQNNDYCTNFLKSFPS